MKSLKKYLIAIIAEAVLVFLVAVSKDIFSVNEAVKIYHILCDSFFAIGFIAAGIGLLIFTTNEGVFDGVTYAVGSFINMFKKDPSKKYASLYDYRESKGRRAIEFGFLLICGLIFVAISLIMYLLYRSCL